MILYLFCYSIAILSDKDFVFLLQLMLLLTPSVMRFSVEDVDIVSNVLNFLGKFGISKLSALRLILPIESIVFNFCFLGNLILLYLAFFADFGIIAFGTPGSVNTGCCHLESSGLK